MLWVLTGESLVQVSGYLVLKYRLLFSRDFVVSSHSLEIPLHNQAAFESHSFQLQECHLARPKISVGMVSIHVRFAIMMTCSYPLFSHVSIATPMAWLYLHVKIARGGSLTSPLSNFNFLVPNATSWIIPLSNKWYKKCSHLLMSNLLHVIFLRNMPLFFGQKNSFLYHIKAATEHFRNSFICILCVVYEGKDDQLFHGIFTLIFWEKTVQFFWNFVFPIITLIVLWRQ